MAVPRGGALVWPEIRRAPSVGPVTSSTQDSPPLATPHGAVFLSYAREDTAAAQRIAEALRSHSVEVWFDQSELRGGDAWDAKIRKQIKECALFVPIVSEHTKARREGYFRLEWKLAVERTHLMAEGVPFIAPVAVDETTESAALVPAEFLRVQWTRLPGALPTTQFVEQIKRMLAAPDEAAVSVPPTRAASVARQSRNRSWAFGALMIVIVALAVALAVSRHSPARPVAAQAETQAQVADSKSIAVLPFENMSKDKDNAFFADGVHEDVLTNLSFIRDLRVVSRTSVMQYRGTTKHIKQIGQELGVAYVLEGSVRREGNKIRVTGQLIDARTDAHVWGKAYDRDVTDIFAIQGELAEAIAGALQSVISPETKALIVQRPTENSEAYDDYLKARKIHDSLEIGGYEKINTLLEDAVRLDPKFAAAWAALASHRANAFFNMETTEQQLGLAKEAIDNAVRLAPDDPAVIEGLGDYYYYGYRDYARATEQYLRLAQMRPNAPIVFESLGLIQRRQGRWADAIPNLQRALKLDPMNSSYAEYLAESLRAVRQFDELGTVLRKAIAEHPGTLLFQSMLSRIAFLERGSTVEVEAFAHLKVEPSEHKEYINAQKDLTSDVGLWADFIRLDREERYVGDPDYPRWMQDWAAAMVFAESGDMVAARTRATEVLAPLQATLKRVPNNSSSWAYLGTVHALLGNKDDALRSMQKSAELMPESRDALIGTANSDLCVLTLAFTGEKDRALAELERLLHVPGGWGTYSARIWLRPLQDDPRFKALISDPKNNEPLL